MREGEKRRKGRVSSKRLALMPPARKCPTNLVTHSNAERARMVARRAEALLTETKHAPPHRPLLANTLVTG